MTESGDATRGELCAACSWPRRGVAADEAARLLVTIGPRFRDVVDALLSLDLGDSLLWLRPGDGVWSVAEYVAHTADAMEHIGRRVRSLVDQDDPELARFGDPNSRDYSGADVADAVARLEMACASIASVLASAPPEALARRGHNELGSVSLLDTASYAVHEVGHHLHDVEDIAAGHRSG